MPADKYRIDSHKYARGPVSRDGNLNAVYNFSKINLHMQLYVTMPQRLAECGLAGGFIMSAKVPEEHDTNPAAKYFEPDKEIVFFDDDKDLVDRCRYYLSHESERLEIAHNMHRRALKEQTVVVAAKTILARWRELLGS